MQLLKALSVLISTPVLILIFQNCGRIQSFNAMERSALSSPRPSGSVDDEILDEDEIVNGEIDPVILPPPTVDPIEIDELKIFYGNNLGLEGIEVGGSKTVLLPQVHTDLMVDISGYDVDRTDEVELLVGKYRIGFLPSCESNKICDVVRVRLPHGLTELTVRQARNPTFRWGFAIEQVSMSDEATDTSQKVIDVESIPGKSAVSLEFTIVDKDDHEWAQPSLVQYRIAGEKTWKDRAFQEYSYEYSTQIQILGGLEGEEPLTPETTYEWRVLVGLERRATEIFSFKTLSRSSTIGLLSN